MTLQWYERIDRKAELDGVRALIPDGGCLVLRGDKGSGRPQAARLCSSYLESFDYRCIRISLVNRAGSIRDYLIAAIEEGRPETEGFRLSAAAEMVNLVDSEVVTQCAHLSATEAKMAFIFEDIDETTPLERHRMPLFGKLAREATCPVIVTSSLSSNWVGVPGTITSTLQDFTLADVRSCLMASPLLGKRPLSEINRLLRTLFPAESSTDATIRPRNAYVFLEAWSRL